MARKLEPEMQAATPINTKGTKMTKTTTKAAKATKATKAPAKRVNKVNDVEQDYLLEGVTPKLVEGHFAKLKVGVTSKGKKVYTFTYSAKGATYADIAKRLTSYQNKLAKADPAIAMTFERVVPKK